MLRKVPVLACEDTRVTRVLLDRIGAHPTLIAVHEHNEARAAQSIVTRIREGQAVALVSDAGTPAISDPGARVVAAAHDAGLPVIPVPGPSAVTAIASAAGLVDGRFRFEGFLPARAKARREHLERLARDDVAIVLYESPHRIRETFEALVAVLEPARTVVVGREITKRFEQIRRLRADALLAWLAEDPNHARGEFALVVAPRAPAPAGDAEGESEAAPLDVDAMLRALIDELPLRQAAKIAAKITGRKANDLYRRALELRPEATD